MTDRPRRDQLTDDMLDQLYGWLDTARAVARAEQKRANQAEAELVVSREVARSNRRHVRAIVPELEKAEAAIARARALHERWDCDANSCASCVDSYGTPVPYPCPTLRALDGTA